MNHGWDWVMVRHGESVSNRIEGQIRSKKRQNPPRWAERIMSDFVPLTENGLWEAWRAACYLKDVLVSAAVNFTVLTSSLLRTRQTAERISTFLHTEPSIIDRNLDEIELPPSETKLDNLRHWLGNLFAAHHRQLILVGSGNILRVVMSILLNNRPDSIPSLKSGSLSRLIRHSDQSDWEIFEDDGNCPIINVIPPIGKTDDDRL